MREPEQTWTIESLRVHTAAMLHAHERADELRHEMLDVAVEKSEKAIGLRFESVNEFRAQLGDQARDFLSRKEYMTAHQSLVEKLDVLGSRLTLAEGRAVGINAGWTYLIAAVGLVATIVAIVLALR